MHKAIIQLIEYAIKHNLIQPIDRIYCYHQLCQSLKLQPIPYEPTNFQSTLIDLLHTPLIEHAVMHQLIEDHIAAHDQFIAQIMNVFTPKPSVLIEKFNALYKQSPQAATDYFYTLSQANDYIKTTRIKKNRHYNYTSPYGNIGITINLSKPEKDPKSIAALKQQISHDYPQCLLCKENVGLYGEGTYPGRSNHRIIPVILNQETFYFQYSPYVYYNEHAIVLHESHIPMLVSKNTFKRLFDFIDQFPHYFLGSNAGLPIVGGSILDHEHYQGGRAKFPIEDAKIIHSTHIDGVTFEILKWPLSVVRLSANSKEALIDAAEKLRVFFESYSDESVDLIAETNEKHNAITPIARKHEDTYILDVALRNNRTNEQYPDGIFHPHKDVHAVKKENIGLIEVMGLAILPARLDQDLKHITQVIAGNIQTFEGIKRYQTWIEQLKTQDITLDEAVGKLFVKGLEDCGIFKQTTQGQAAFIRFLESYLTHD